MKAEFKIGDICYASRGHLASVYPADLIRITSLMRDKKDNSIIGALGDIIDDGKFNIKETRAAHIDLLYSIDDYHLTITFERHEKAIKKIFGYDTDDKRTDAKYRELLNDLKRANKSIDALRKNLAIALEDDKLINYKHDGSEKNMYYILNNEKVNTSCLRTAIMHVRGVINMEFEDRVEDCCVVDMKIFNHDIFNHTYNSDSEKTVDAVLYAGFSKFLTVASDNTLKIINQLFNQYNIRYRLIRKVESYYA